MVKVLEVDQHTSTGHIESFTFADFDLNQVSGGDSEAARALGIASAVVKEVSENWSPPWGRVWFREGPSGKLRFWKANYDSSG